MITTGRSWETATLLHVISWPLIQTLASCKELQLFLDEELFADWFPSGEIWHLDWFHWTLWCGHLLILLSFLEGFRWTLTFSWISFLAQFALSILGPDGFALTSDQHSLVQIGLLVSALTSLILSLALPVKSIGTSKNVQDIPVLSVDFSWPMNTGTTRSPKKNQAFISSAKSISVRVFYPIDDEIVQGTDLLEQHRFDFNWEFIENMFKRIPKLFMTQLKLVQLKSFRLTGKTGTKKSPRSSGVVIDNSCEKTRHIDLIPVRDQKESRQYPVVIVTQDYNGIEVNALDGLCEKLAKKEMIVVAVKHGKHENSPWNHVNVPFVSMDSKDAPMDSSNHELLENRLESRSEEIVQILDHLLAIHYGQNPYSFYHNDHEAAGREEMATALFKNRLNLENLIVLGHSFSAGIALQSANIDRRVKMVVCVDAWLQPVCNDLIECGTPCPLLLLQSGPKFFVDTTHQLNESNNDDRAKHIVAHSPGSYLFRLKDMNHFALLDVMQLLPTWIMKLSGYSGRRLFKRLDTKEHVDIQEVVATFVDAVLKKDIHMGGKGRTSMHWSKFGFDYRTTSSSSSSAASASSRPMYPKNPSSSGNAEDWWDRLLTGERLFSDISVERFGW